MVCSVTKSSILETSQSWLMATSLCRYTKGRAFAVIARSYTRLKLSNGCY